MTAPEPDTRSMSDLIARSSLGTPKARRARARISMALAHEILAHADEQDRTQNVGEQSTREHYIVSVDGVPPRRNDAAHHQSPAPRRREGEAVRKNYPATKAGLRRMGRDMQKELAKGMKPVQIPVTYQVTRTNRIVPSGSSWPVASDDTVNNNYYGDQYYGDNVSVDGDGNVIAVGNQGPVNQSIGDTGQSGDEWRMALLEALGNVQGHLDEFNLNDDDRDTIQDAAVSAAAIAASEDEDEVDDALRRRGKRVLGILEKVGTAASGDVIAQTLASLLQQLLS